METNSDHLPLEVLPRVRVPRPWRRHIETAFVILALFGGGFGLGAIGGYRIAESDHLAEINRLQQAYGTRLTGLSTRVEIAADKANNAAQVAGEAAQAVKQNEVKR